MRFALAGNPNSGKTTLFNALTGSTARTGNWPGVTVDKRTGKYKPLKADIVDLPGIYSLSPYTPEEVVARNYITDERPDCIINIVDSTNLERNLYLTTQLMELDIPIVVALNMTDALNARGDKIDSAKLEKQLGLYVVPISALKGKGIKELMEKADAAAKRKREGVSVVKNSSVGELYSEVYARLGGKDRAFRAVKLIEGDEIECKKEQKLAAETAALAQAIDTGDFEGDFEGVVADIRYKRIGADYAPVLKRRARVEGMTKSDKVDRVLTHRIWGIPIFLLIMFTVFHLTFSENLFFIGLFIPEGSFDILYIGTDAINSPGAMLASLMELATNALGGLAADGLANSPAWVSGLVCDGLLAGVFAVLSFIPQIMVLFLFLSILEDSGYMARVAFIMDRAFRRFGLSGKAFMPLLSCFGCAVPGIMATRTLESEQERRRTIMLTPFFSCGAKLPIWATFAAVMFGGRHSDLVVFSMYLIGIVVAIIAAFVLKKTAVKGETPPFIMELPEYHKPQFKNTMIHLWGKLKHYIFRAATVIAGAVVVIWFLQSFNFRFQMVEDSGDSILGIIGKGLQWLFVPLGFGMGEDGWKFVVACFTGLIAKEMVVAAMGTFAGMANPDDIFDMAPGEIAATPLAAMIATLSVPAAFAFMAFNLLSVPCMAAVGAANGEFSKKRHLFGAIGFWLLSAYLVSAVIYWVGTYWWIGLILAAVIAAAIAISIIIKKKRNSNKLDRIKEGI